MSTPDLDAIQNRSDDAMMHESLEPGSYAEIAWHSARDVPALLAYARDLEARLERVEKLASAWEVQGDRDMAFSKTIRNEDISILFLTEGAAKVENARHVRAALTASDAS